MDEILNSRSINGIRFRMAKPQGYYTEDVENFIDNEVRNSIATYEVKVSDQEREITNLNNKIDALNSKISELEIKANFNDASGNAEQDEALVNALERNEVLEKQVASLTADLTEKEEFIKQLNAYIDEVQPYIEAGIGNVNSEPAEEAVLVTVEEEYVEESIDAEPEAEAEDEVELEDEIDDEPEAEEDDEIAIDDIDDDLEVDAKALQAALEDEDSYDDEEIDDELEVDAEALQAAIDEDAPKKAYIKSVKKTAVEEEPEIVEEKIIDTFFEMDDDLEVDEEALRKALEESDGDDEIKTGYR